MTRAHNVVMNRRHLLRGVAASSVLLGGAALLVACGSGTTASPATATASSTGSAAPTVASSATGATIASLATTAISSIAPTSSLAAASSSAAAAASKSSGEVSVLYYTSTDPAVQRMKKQETAINQLLPQIKLTMIPINSDIDGKFTTMSAGGAPPDIAWMGVGFWGHAPAGRLLALDGLVAQDKDINLKEYYPQSTALFTYQGHADALPYGVNTHVMVYNKGMFDKAGAQYPTADWTMSDYVSTAKRMTSGPNVTPATWGAWVWNLWIGIWMNGGQIYDKDFTKSLIDQPRGVDGVQFYYDQNFGKLQIAPQKGTYTDLFGNSQLAITHVGPFGVPVLRKYSGAEWDFVTMPYYAEKQRGTWLSGEGYAIASATKNKDGAWAVLKYLCGKDAMANFYAPEFQAIPAVQSVAESAFVNAIPGKNAKAFLDSIGFATAYGGNPVVTKWGDPLNQMWDAVQKGQKTAQDAAQQCATQLDSLLKTVAGAAAK